MFAIEHQPGFHLQAARRGNYSDITSVCNWLTLLVAL